MTPPEVCCMEPENYKKIFRALYWTGERKYEKRTQRNRLLKRKLRFTSYMVCNAPYLLGNASQFAVYAAVRQSVLSRWKDLCHTSEASDESDNEDMHIQLPQVKIAKVTGLGLRAVVSLIAESKQVEKTFCEKSLTALLDILQGHAPEELSQEPSDVILGLHEILTDIAGGSGLNDADDEGPTNLTALGSACLISLSISRGETELILNAVTSLIMSKSALSEQYILVPSNLICLQKSVQAAILGSPSRNLWLNYGVPNQSLVTSFPVDLPSELSTLQGDLIVRSLASDGCYLYVYTSRGLVKIGSGYGSSIRQHVYLYKNNFFCTDRHGWLGYCKDKLYVRIGRKKTDIYEVDKESLQIKNIIRFSGQMIPADSKTALFSDGNNLGIVTLSNYDNLCIKLFDIEVIENGTSLKLRKELNVHLFRERTLSMGCASEDSGSRRPVELEAPYAVQLDDSDDDPLMSINAGLDFTLLLAKSGKVYYNGKGSSLGYKESSPDCCRWTLIKETSILKSDNQVFKKCKVLQVAVGHEGIHAVILLDNGVPLFTGLSRRGEDGDHSKYRRAPKPTRPKIMPKVEGHYIVYVACNYGTSALVTKQGQVFMFGKDTLHCDPNGVVTGLKYETITKIELGKAHAVTLTSNGQVFTFGINNKGQCGRDFGSSKDKAAAAIKRASLSVKEEEHQCPLAQHNWLAEFCRICVVCKECTGFSSACQCSDYPNRVPREKCGCGEGDSGCSSCGICRLCADAGAAHGSDQKLDKSDLEVLPPAINERKYEIRRGGGPIEIERDQNLKMACLSPARIAIPGGHKVTAISCGMHHSVLLTQNGDVLTFGSNQFGQLGAGDISVHHRIVRVRVPRAISVAAGSNHTAVVTRDGELYTFGSFEKGALGRPRLEESPSRSERLPLWYATPGRVPRLGPKHSSKAVSVSASGDQTFVHVSQAIIKTDTLFSSTITANNNTIVILPNRPEHTFKCITINKNDGSCHTWTGPEQVDFVNSLTCLDPLYDVLWCYQPQIKVMKCYNILAFDSHKLQRCCALETDGSGTENECEYPNYGEMKRIEDFKNIEAIEAVTHNDDKKLDNVALTNMSILNQELAIPAVSGCSVTRMHAALHLLGCLDSLTFAHDSKLNVGECKNNVVQAPNPSAREDFLAVNRFESHGGGWGYSSHSIEAIRFMSDTDIALVGVGLFGGRGDYTARIKIYDIGTNGGDEEGDGEIIAESEEVVFECAPREKYPILFENSIPIMANRWYIIWANINGPSSDCGASGKPVVLNEDITFNFKSSKKSNNGTDVNAGQIPCIFYSTTFQNLNDQSKNMEVGEPIIVLSKNISRKITVPCFTSLITLLKWSWDTFKLVLLDTNGQVPINYSKLTTMKHQKRLVYVIRACLRLIRSYINDLFPPQQRRMTADFRPYLESITDIRNLIQVILADPIPTCAMIPRKTGKHKAHRVCYVQFALEMVNSIHKECHETVMSCFHAFFTTPILRWNHLCFLLSNVKEGDVPPNHTRELTSTCGAMCSSRILRDVLNYIVPITHHSGLVKDSRPSCSKSVETPSKSATVPRSSKPPPVPPRVHGSPHSSKHKAQGAEGKVDYKEWHLLDVLPIMLDVIMTPIKLQMMTRPCGHDHGELKHQERLSKSCCKLLARIVAELTHWCAEAKEDLHTTTSNQYVSTPSRFMRVNQSRVWNTGSGSPDAICFAVDKPGLILVGVGAYGGLGSFTYELELLHDDRFTLGSGEDVGTHCWVSKEVARGTFTSADCHNDIVHLKFERPVTLKENVRYAVRLSNNGGRTVNGDCGLPNIKGPDGTTFRFASSSLSFNGTNISRGQIPCLLYTGSSKYCVPNADNASRILNNQRALTIAVASIIMERSAEMLCTLRNELTAEDLKRNASVLQSSPAILTLLPFTMANLEGLNDPKSSVKLLEIIHKLLPHVAAMNLLLPSVEEVTSASASTAPARYYTWVESDHPYKQATVNNTRVLFPASVAWVVLEMDPRSITSQPEDTLTIYAVAGNPKQKCHCSSNRDSSTPFRKRIVQLTNETGDVVETELCDDAADDARCLHYNCTYVAITPKLSHLARDWPKEAILVPGNEVIFSLETATDYLHDYNKSDGNDESHYGYRCLCVGYEDISAASQRHGLASLEMELAYAGAQCASRLLAPDLEVPSLDPVTVASVVKSSFGAEGAEFSKDACEALLYSRGLELSSPPTILQVLEGQKLTKPVSTERQFLADFVAAIENTAGGRLATWLAPTPQVDPSKCEVKGPASPILPSVEISLQVIVKDQYGDIVISSALQTQIQIQRLPDKSRKRNLSSDEMIVTDIPYQVTVKDSMRYQAITFVKGYQNFSFEELRLASGIWGEVLNADDISIDRVTALLENEGIYRARWTPKMSGTYVLQSILDEHFSPQELLLEVVEPIEEEPIAEGAGDPSPPPVQLRRFSGNHTNGLRVRVSPSLQAEEIGAVDAGSCVSIVEEVENKDGIWVRLSSESINTFAEGGGSIAWCLQYHRHLDRLLLEPMEPWTSGQATYEWSGVGDSQGELHKWGDDVGEDMEGNAETQRKTDERKPPSAAAQSDDSDSSDISCVDPLQPKKERRAPKYSSPKQVPRRMERRSNGNSYNDILWPPDQEMLAITQDENNDKVPTESPGCSLAQAGTQTSPEIVGEVYKEPSLGAIPKNYKSSPTPRERSDKRLRAGRLEASPPPVPVRTIPPAPKKTAISPAQGECLRALFAAILWHEGIVHDAIAGSAFLKFHPQLPKQGARVVTRSVSSEITSHRHQRHSVEVSSASQYLRIQESTLETLTRSGMEATASRARRVGDKAPPPINEEDIHSNDNNDVQQTNVVNVLPPALRALVALWDTLWTTPTLASASEQLMTRPEFPFEMFLNKNVKREQKPGQALVTCELCGMSVIPPLITHLRQKHIGCRTLTIHGYPKHGSTYKRADPYAPAPSVDFIPPTTAPCGTIAKSYQLFYMFCVKCRDKALKAVLFEAAKSNDTIDSARKTEDNEEVHVDHTIIKENALFLLDLAPLNANTESLGESPWQDSGSRIGASPPTPPGSLWQPAPPFQCLSAFLDDPESHNATHIETTRYHSLGRPQPSTVLNFGHGGNNSTNGSPLHWRRVQRSVSMSQAAEFINAVKPAFITNRARPVISHDTLTGGGSSLLAQPSPALLTLVGCGEWTSGVSAFKTPTVDPDVLIKRPVIEFVLTKRHLSKAREKMDAIIKMNSVRQYAFEALNWLLRSVTQPTCVHDIMWWFCGALQKYARLSPSLSELDDDRLNAYRAPTTPPAAALCPGGRSARGTRVALHAFLGSVSALVPSLPPAGAATLQAVRCWALDYSTHDRVFLHRSQVFSVISKLLSHAEDGYDDSMLGAFHDSFQSNTNKESYVWTCPDVTSWCDVTVSSRPGMAGALTDGTTETFWESGEDDRNRAKWIQLFYPGACPEDRPHLVCIHLDNTRDTAFKTLLCSFLYSEGSRELYHVQDVEVDAKAAAWFCCPLPRVSGLALRVRCELRGPDPTTRIRQIRVLSAPTPMSAAATPSPSQLLHALIESETLRVFRLVTSQVFGKLLEWDRISGSESEGENVPGTVSPTPDHDDSDLREHVVGILFAGHKLTSLQSQVMSHIVAAIGGEAARARDDWETNLMCLIERTEEESNPPVVMQQITQDNYCFEMLSLLLALSGSTVGCAHLAQRTELLSDLLALLHTGSERVQRQVISLLRRMISEISPQKMLASINYGKELNARVTLMDHLLSYLSKAITIQVKIKGCTGATTPATAVMGSSIAPSAPGYWFMRGQTTKKHAHLVARLLSDMVEGKVNEAWRTETRIALTSYTVRLASIGESERVPARCLSNPAMWMALSTLCVCEASQLELVTNDSTGIGARSRDSCADARPFCSNHDDGETLAVIDCATCGPLCPECDRFLHLNRAARTHHRQICKEEESAIRIDIHEGCGRAKLFWLLLLVDRRTLKGLAEFRGVGGRIGEPAANDTTSLTGPPGLIGLCRFCGTRGNTGLLAIGNVCPDAQCQEHGKEACSHVLSCGHLCGGVRGERRCLPCLFGCTPPSSGDIPLRQDADDMCMICFTDPLQAAPAIQLKCGHVFHLHCCKNVLKNKWNGPRITFSFSQCPICKDDIQHWTLEDFLEPIRLLRQEVQKKALMRLEYEGLSASGNSRVRSGALPDPSTYAMERYAYYVCHKCGKAYFGGLARCEAETNNTYEPAELVCGACSDVTGALICPKHGADFLEYKCRYCCSVAVFFCFGTSHFCNTCHDDFQRVTNLPRNNLPHCPAGPKGEQLPGSADECPLRVHHPPTGEEFALGCGVCRHAQGF